MRIRSTGAPLYRLKVTLRGSRPTIWRRFVVPSNITLKRCHDALQAVMGWTDGHLHQFEARGTLYGTSDREFGVHRISETRTSLDEVHQRPKDRMRYEYDFGDSWEHDVVLEAILPSEPGGIYPQVEAGKASPKAGTADGRVVPTARRSAVSRQAGWISPVVVVSGVVRGSYDAGRLMRADEWEGLEGCDAVLLTHGD